MADNEIEVQRLMRSRVAELVVQAADGDDRAEEALIELAMSDPLAEAALVVVLELQFTAAERADRLPRPAPEIEARLEEAVRSMLKAKE